MRQRGEKTVYVFGAGLSRGVGGPSQSELLRGILAREKLAKGGRLPELQFIRDVFLGGSEIPETFPLENVLTLFDRAIQDGMKVKGTSVKRMMDFRMALIEHIASVVTHSLRGPIADEVQEFADALYLWRSSAPKDSHFDPFSILTFNWDIVIDHALFVASGGYHRHDVPAVDYCTYVDPLDEGRFARSSHYGRALGVPNLKIVKLHGSLNWLLCSQCNRLFVDLEEKAGNYAFAPHATHKNTCRACNTRLEPVIIAPTFLKDLRSVHLKSSWHNAEIELSEATRVVFVGYSLPLADFEARCLFARSIPKEANVEVYLRSDPWSSAVDWSSEVTALAVKRPPAKRSATKPCSKAGRLSAEVEELLRKPPSADRFAYEDFFGKDRLTFLSCDAKGFLKSETQRIKAGLS